MNRIDVCDAKDCHRQIVWLPHVRSGKKSPIEFAPVPERGNVIPVDRHGDPCPIVGAVAYRVKLKAESWNEAVNGSLYVNHFASCPDALRFRQQSRAKAAALDAQREMGDERDPEDVP